MMEKSIAVNRKRENHHKRTGLSRQRPSTNYRILAPLVMALIKPVLCVVRLPFLDFVSVPSRIRSGGLPLVYAGNCVTFGSCDEQCDEKSQGKIVLGGLSSFGSLFTLRDATASLHSVARSVVGE